MRHFLLLAALLLPSLAWAQGAPPLPECLVRPPGAQLVSVQEGDGSNELLRRYVFTVPNRRAAYIAVRDMLRSRFAEQPGQLIERGGENIHFPCEGRLQAYFKALNRQSPGEVFYELFQF